MYIHLCVIQSRTELGSKSYIFMENDKTISLTNLFQHLLSAQNFIWIKNWINITIFSEKFLNQCKEQANEKVVSNMLPLYKISSWIWQLSHCKK